MKKLLPVLISFVAFASFAPQAFALTVSPARIENLNANPGQTVSGEIQLFNEQSDAKVFYPSFQNFEARGDGGQPFFTDSATGLATWIKTVDSVSVAAGERKSVPFTVTVPKDAKAGGYFSAVFFGTQKPATAGENSQVAIGGKVGVLILFRVNGDIPESAGLSQFGIIGGRRIFSTLPVAFQYAFHNTGGDRVVPKGQIFIQNTFRMGTTQLDANPNLGSVLPNSLRRFSVTWGDTNAPANIGFMDAVKQQWSDFHFGWYTSTLNLSWGQTLQTANVSYHFFIFPWQILSIVVLGLLVLKLILSQYKKSVIKGVQQSQQQTTKGPSQPLRR